MKTPPLRRALLLGALVAILAGPGLSMAQCVKSNTGDTLCPPAETRCVQDRYGNWFCSAAGGDANIDRYGTPVCGAGACVKDRRGDVQCSSQPRGNAALDTYGVAVCSSSCAPGTAQACTPLTK